MNACRARAGTAAPAAREPLPASRAGSDRSHLTHPTPARCSFPRIGHNHLPGPSSLPRRSSAACAHFEFHVKSRLHCEDSVAALLLILRGDGEQHAPFAVLVPGWTHCAPLGCCCVVDDVAMGFSACCRSSYDDSVRW